MSARSLPSRLQLNPEVVFELCVDTVEAALAAEEGGADRIELCRSLGEGGLTPGPILLQRVLQFTNVPVHAMIRPRGGDFFGSAEDLDAMEDEILAARSSGCAGVVLGVLRVDGSVDTALLRNLVCLASPMEVTFHRAFDEARDLPEALEQVIAAGVARVLTSGGCATASEGALTIARLVQQAAGRIQIAIGGGVDAGNVVQLVSQTGATHVHASLRGSVEQNGDVAPRVQAVREFTNLVRSMRMPVMSDL